MTKVTRLLAKSEDIRLIRASDLLSRGLGGAGDDHGSGCTSIVGRPTLSALVPVPLVYWYGKVLSASSNEVIIRLANSSIAVDLC